MDYNIALLPTLETEQKLIELGSQIQQHFGSQFRLNRKDSLPHITLYLAGFPPAGVDEIQTKLSAICSQYSPAKIHIKGGTISKSGLVMLNCIVSDELKLLHRQIVNEINPIRDGIVADNWIDGLAKFDERQSFLLNKFGYSYALELWYPHFTIAKVNPLDIEEVKSLVNEFDEEFTVQTVGLGYAGNSGVFKRLLFSCELDLR